MARKSKRDSLIHSSHKVSNKYQTAIYARLSAEDISEDSIENQIAMLKKYVDENDDLELADIYCDNGKTGTNFNRPEFSRLLEDIKSGLINCIVVKDLSRFGRSYIETEEYMQIILPFFNVRFIALADGYDNLNDKYNHNLTISVKNLMNGYYPQEVSKKVSQAYHMKQTNGEFIGQYAAYGYMKSSLDKHKLVIDEEVAPIVKKIFSWKAEGLGNLTISRKLNELNILSPNNYRYSKGIVKSEKYSNPLPWKADTVKIILNNPIYLGHMVQGKKRAALYKKQPERKRVNREDWIVVQNTHEPIIEESIYNKAQSIMDERKKQKENHKYLNETDNIFKGILLCGNCGRILQRHKIPLSDNSVKYSFLCPTHLETLNQGCKREILHEHTLKDVVYKVINVQIKQAINMTDLFKQISASVEYQSQAKNIENQISDLDKKISRVKMLQEALYEDLTDGLLVDSEYKFLKNKYINDEKNFKKSLELLLAKKETFHITLTSSNKWVTAFKKFEKSKELTFEMVSSLIKSITVNNDNSLSVVWNYSDIYLNTVNAISMLMQEVCV